MRDPTNKIQNPDFLLRIPRMIILKNSKLENIKMGINTILPNRDTKPQKHKQPWLRRPKMNGVAIYHYSIKHKVQVSEQSIPIKDYEFEFTCPFHRTQFTYRSGKISDYKKRRKIQQQYHSKQTRQPLRVKKVNK